MTLFLADLVEYNGDGYRVKSFMRKQFYDEVWVEHPDDAIDQIVNDIISEERLREKFSRLERGLPANRLYRFIWCHRDEATHVGLYGLRSQIAPIDECVKTGTLRDEWGESRIAEEEHRAERLIDSNLTRTWEWE